MSETSPKWLYAQECEVDPRSGAPVLRPMLGEPDEIKRLRSELEEARGRIAELEADVTFHKEIADAREFDFHEAEKRAVEPTDEDGFTKSEQAYQVIGVLATIANCFEHPEVTRALDYFSSDRFDPEFLPFSASAICAALESAALEGKSDA